MKKQVPLIIMAVFGIFIFLGMLLFSGAIKVGKDKKTTTTIAGSNLMMWGTLPREAMTDPLAAFSQDNQITLNYIQKTQDEIDFDLGEAIASGRGPDLVLGSHELLMKHQSKLVHIPYDKFSDRAYRDLYVDGARVFMLPDGIFAFPFLVDPLIFYFNRVSYNNAGILEAPKTWNEVKTYSETLTRKSDKDTILESGISLGTFNNIGNAKDILALLLLQAGNNIVSMGGTADAPEIQATLIRGNETTSKSISEYVVEYFTQFSDPLKSTYTWNRIMPEASEAFYSEQSAQYIGFASEIAAIRAKNPNLDFDIAPIPQAENVKAKKTFGRVYGIGVVKASKQQFAAYQAMLLMKEKTFSDSLLQSTLALYPIAPVRKDLLTKAPGTQYGSLLWNSAILSTAWLDPNYTETYTIFEDLITNVIRGSVSTVEAIQEADARLNDLLR